VDNQIDDELGSLSFCQSMRMSSPPDIDVPIRDLGACSMRSFWHVVIKVEVTSALNEIVDLLFVDWTRLIVRVVVGVGFEFRVCRAVRALRLQFALSVLCGRAVDALFGSFAEFGLMVIAVASLTLSDHHFGKPSPYLVPVRVDLAH